MNEKFPRWAEHRSHTVVVVFVCLSVGVPHGVMCVFLRDGNELSNESCNATTTRHSTTAKLARFLL